MEVEQLENTVYVGSMERVREWTTTQIDYHQKFVYVDVHYSAQEHKIVEEVTMVKQRVKDVSNMEISEFNEFYIVDWEKQIEQVYTPYIKKNIKALLVRCHNCLLNKEIQEKIFPK